MAVPVPPGSRRAPGENKQINIRRAPLVSKSPRGEDQQQHVPDEDSEDAWGAPSEIPRRTGCPLHPATFLTSPEVSLPQPVVFSDLTLNTLQTPTPGYTGPPPRLRGFYRGRSSNPHPKAR